MDPKEYIHNTEWAKLINPRLKKIRKSVGAGIDLGRDGGKL